MISERIVLLAVLTAAMYGLSIYMQDGTYILPFGLYKIGVLLVAIILLIANRKKIRLMEITMLIWGVALAASSKFVLQLFFSDSDFEKDMLAINAFSAWSFLTFAVFLFFWQLLLAFEDKTIYKWLQIANAVAMLMCLVGGIRFHQISDAMFVWLIVPTSMWLLTVFLSRNENPMHKSLAGLLGFAIVSSWCSALYFGLEAILGNL